MDEKITYSLRLSARPRRGMTLLELIIVLVLLAVMMALTAPSLSRFFAGRRLTEEGRRLVALTRYARSEAISRGEPMIVWFDPENNSYGMEPFRSYASNTLVDTEDQEKVTLEYELKDDLSMEVYQKESQEEVNLDHLICLPDGTLQEGGVYAIDLKNKKEDELKIVRLADRPVFIFEDELSDDEYSVQDDLEGSTTRRE